MYCTITALVFCLAPHLPGNADIHFHQTIGIDLTLSARGWQMDYSGGDVVVPINAAGMAKACEGANCVDYSRHCENKNKKKVCDLAIRADGYPTRIRFVADNDERMKEAFGSLGFVRWSRQRPNSADAVIPFALFTREMP